MSHYNLTPEEFRMSAHQFTPTDKYRYAVPYTQLLKHLPQGPNIIELGIGENAASLQMWRDVLKPGPHPVITGVDRVPEFVASAAGHRFNAINADFDDHDSMVRIAKDYGPFDMVIDDGSHFASHIFNNLQIFWGHLKPGGVYVVEDLETNDRKKYHRNFKFRPWEHLSGMMEKDCKGKPFEESNLYYVYRNMVAIVKQ